MPTNRDRAHWAEDALDHFARLVGQEDEDLETNATDFLCDLLHLCDFENLDFDVILERAKGHYEEEWREEYPARIREQVNLFSDR